MPNILNFSKFFKIEIFGLSFPKFKNLVSFGLIMAH